MTVLAQFLPSANPTPGPQCASTLPSSRGPRYAVVMRGAKTSTLKTAPVPLPEERKGPTPRDILEQALKESTEARVLFESQSLVAVGRIAAVDLDAVTLVLAGFRVELDLRWGGVAVAFWKDGRAFAFAGRVIGAYPEGQQDTRLLVELPSILPRFETRACFRVPITNPERATAWITLEDGSLLLVVPRDIGYGGALVEIGDADQAPEAGSAMRLTMRIDQVHLDLEARVRRVGGNFARILFPVAWQNGRLAPPPELAGAVDAIQRRWLRERVGPRD